VEFVSLIDLPPAHQQAICLGLGLAIAEAELTAAGLERQHAGHRAGLASAIFEGSAL
jgi:hypothetical protein